MRRYLTFALLLCASCVKMEDPIGDYPVYLKLDLTFEDKALRSVPSSKAYTMKDINANIERTGFGGVLVVHAISGSFYAFDLACPHEASRSTLVAADADHLNAVCPKCGTKYEIGIEGSGAPDGVSKFYLKRYAVTGSDPRLIVSN
jgi:nitrite reductase/ring-hydroxylating ferredoxin subunit